MINKLLSLINKVSMKFSKFKFKIYLKKFLIPKLKNISQNLSFLINF